MADTGLPRVVFVDLWDLPQGRKPTTADIKRALNALQERLVKEAEQGAARAIRRAKAQIAREEEAKQPDHTQAAQAATEGQTP